MTARLAVRLRPLRWWDIAEIAPLEQELFPDDPWPVEAFWAELALGADRTYLVAQDADGPDAPIVGYAGLSCPSPARGADAEVMTLAVAPAAQGHGVARTLLDALVEAAQDRGAGRLMLEVRADNQAARGLYAAAGFEPVATRPGYYRRAVAGPDGAGTVDALVLRLVLPPRTNHPAAAADSVQQ